MHHFDFEYLPAMSTLKLQINGPVYYW